MTNGKGITATTYDWRNLPLSITVTNPVFPFTPIAHTYRYDPDGHRVYSSVDQTYTVRGAYGEPIAEYAGSTPALKYWHYIRPDGVVIGRKEGSNRFYYHRDHLGSTRAVLSHHSSPNVVETYDYMPFGEFMSGRILTSGTGTRPKYTGHAFDDETNLHNMQWRRQIPRYGVFRTVDPMADSYPGWNTYAYVMNDPMTYTDPDGRIPWPLRNVTITSPWGAIRSKGSSPHRGVDMRASIGTSFYSLGKGKITQIGQFSDGTKFIEVQYGNGHKVRFLHIQSVRPGLKKGDTVYEGQILGETGNSGPDGTDPHLHIDATDQDGNRVRPLDNYGKLSHDEFWNLYQGDYRNTPEYKRENQSPNEEHVNKYRLSFNPFTFLYSILKYILGHED